MGHVNSIFSLDILSLVFSIKVCMTCLYYFLEVFFGHVQHIQNMHLN